MIMGEVGVLAYDITKLQRWDQYGLALAEQTVEALQRLPALLVWAFQCHRSTIRQLHQGLVLPLGKHQKSLIGKL